LPSWSSPSQACTSPWRQGSAGGGEGGVIAGIALFAGAVARLLLPARLAGLLGTRKRVTDVVTLTISAPACLSRAWYCRDRAKAG